MKFKNIPKSSLFRQYLTSYLLVFFVPLILFLIVINTIYIQSIQEEVATTNLNTLEQVSLQFDEQIFELNTIGNQINYSPDYSPHTLRKAEDYSDQINLLRLHYDSTRASKGIYLYLNEEDTVISFKGMMSVKGLINNDANFNIQERADFLENLATAGESISSYTMKHYVTNDFDKKVVYYMMPLGDPQHKIGTLIFVVNMDQVFASLKAIEGEGLDRTNIVLNHDNDVVFAQGDLKSLNKIDLINDIPDKLNDETSQIKHLKYTVANKKSSLTGWNFVTLIKTSQLYLPFYRVLIFFGIGLVVVSALGLIASYYFARKNYHPIDNLLKNFTKSDQDVGNAWSYIKYNVTKTQSERKLLNQLIDEQAPIVRNSTMLNLIEGKRKEGSENLIRELKEANIHFPYDLFSLLILEFDEEFIETENIFDLENVVQNITNIKTDDFQLEATIPYLNNNQILVVVNLKQENHVILQDIMKLLQEIINLEELLEACPYKIAVGETYDSLFKIKTSYIEAIYVLEQSAFSEDNQPSISFFKELIIEDEKTFASQTIKYPETEMSIILQSLAKGNEQTALETLYSLLDELSSYDKKQVSTQLISSYIFNSILKEAITQEVKSIDEQYLPIQDIGNLTDIELMKEILENLISEISEEILKKEQLESIRIEKDVVNYIYNNYQSSEISLEQIASNNNVSISYASKLIKEETGESFSAIIQDLRMKKFKELLIETNSPIKDLVTEIGYYDVSNFTRKFREENNMTPGKFRKTYKK